MLGIAFLFFGRNYLINEYRDGMDRNADEVVRAASALSMSESINSWDLRMVITSMASSSGDHIFVTDSGGIVVLCSDKQLVCPHIGVQMSQNVMGLLQDSGSIDQLTNLDGF